MLTLGVIGETITSAGIWLVSGVYHVAAWSFELFLILANGQLLETSVYQQLIKNFYVILGIVMLFFLSFTLLKSMINPDDQNKGTSTAKNVLINLVTSAIIMALLPTIFTFLFDFQTSIISNQNTIGKFFGYGGTGDITSTTNKSDFENVKRGAFQIVNGVYTAFFNVNTATLNCPDITSVDTLENCQKQPRSKKNFGAVDEDGNSSLKAAINLVNEKGNFGIYTNFSKSVSNDEIDFNFILSLVGGVLLAYVGISFCIDMAVRLVKLVFYQLIAPIPIFARIIPDTKLSSSFNQWLKVTLTCYMEVFVRIFIIYFTIFLCKNMLDSHFLREQVYGYGGLIALFAKAFILMGIIIFMRQAPKLLSDVTGLDSGNMKLGLRDKLKDAGIFAAGNALGSLVASHGNPLAALRGWKHGWSNANMQNIGAEASRRRDYLNARKSGATLAGIARNKVRSIFGYDTVADQEQRQFEDKAYDVQNKSTTDIQYVDSNGNVQTIKTGASWKINQQTAEALKSKKTENIGKMSEANEELRRIEKDVNYNDSQRTMIKTLESEADADFEKGKYLATVFYDDGTGVVKKQITSEEFKEMQKNGYQFYDSDGPTKNKISINDVRTSIRKNRVIQEASSNSGNMTKRAEEEFIISLKNNDGYSYESFNYDKNGLKLVDQNGRALVNSGSFEVANDGSVVYTQKIVNVDGNGKAILDANGNVSYDTTKTIFTRDAKGSYKKEVRNENGQVISSGSIDIYDFAKLFDTASKSNANVLSAKQQDIKEVRLQGYESENSAIDNLIKQRDEAKEAAQQSLEHRKREVEKAYHANRNNK